MLVGLVPANILVGPLLPYVVILIFVMLIFYLGHGINPFKMPSVSLPPFLSILGAATGVWALGSCSCSERRKFARGAYYTS